MNTDTIKQKAEELRAKLTELANSDEWGFIAEGDRKLIESFLASFAERVRNEAIEKSAEVADEVEQSYRGREESSDKHDLEEQLYWRSHASVCKDIANYIRSLKTDQQKESK